MKKRPNIGIKEADCKFYINREKRTVICVIPKTALLLEDFIENNFNFSDINIIDAITFSKNGEKAMRMPSYFMGKAKCSNEDEWDEELGKLIAFSRAKDKCYKSFFRRANNLVQAIDARLTNMIETFNLFGQKLDDKHIQLTDKIESRIQNKEE